MVFYCLSQKRSAWVQVALVLCITLNMNKNRVLLLKCWPGDRLRKLKNKGKSPLVIHKSGRGRLPNGRLRELFITEFKWQVKRGFTMLVVTRAGRLREWSQGELWLYSRLELGPPVLNVTSLAWGERKRIKETSDVCKEKKGIKEMVNKDTK